MAKYTLDNVMSSSGEFRGEFEEFVRNTLVKNTIITDMDSEESLNDAIAAVDSYAAFYMFRSAKGDFSDEEFASLGGSMNLIRHRNPEEFNEKRNKLAHTYWGTDFDKLPNDKKAFVIGAQEALIGRPVTIEDIEKRHDEYLAREIEEEEKAKAAKEAEAQTKFNNKDAVYEDFSRLADNQYGDAPKEEIEEFIKNKNAYIAAHPEEKDEIESHLSATLNSKDDQIYGSDVYQISDAFREQYKALDELMSVRTLDIEKTQENKNNTVLEDKTIPDLGQTMTLSGYNNAGYLQNIVLALDGLEDGRRKEILTAVKEAYETRKPELLQDIIKTQEDIEIAKDVTKAFGFDEGDYPTKIVKMEVEKTQETPVMETVRETRRVPNLGQALTELGYNNKEVADRLDQAIEGMEDGHKKEMYTKVRDAYKTRTGIAELYDLIQNEDDVTIAKDIVATLGYEDQKSAFPYPEMDKEIEITRPIAVPVHSNTGDENTGKDDGSLNVGVLPGGPGREKPGNEGDDNGGAFGIGGTGDNGGGDKNNEQEEEDFFGRFRMPNSDVNDANLDRLSYDVLNGLGKIKKPLTEEQLNDENLVYSTVQSTISSLNDKETTEYNVTMMDHLLETGKIGVVPPTVLTQAYDVYGEQIAKAKDEETKNAFKAKRDAVGAQMDFLTDQYYTGVSNITRDNFNYDDNTNIADVYDGYKEMIEKRRPDVEEAQQQKIDAVSDKLDKDIGEYDKYWGIDGITKDNINQVRENHTTLTKRMENITLDDETMQFLGNIRFHDEMREFSPEEKEEIRRSPEFRQYLSEHLPNDDMIGNGDIDALLDKYSKEEIAIPQFINPETKEESVTWQKGFEIKPGSQLEAMVDLARNNTIISNVAADVKSLSDEDLQTAFADRVKIQAFAWDGAENTVKGVVERHDRYTDPKFLEEFKTRMMDPNRPLNISKQGFDATLKLSVNDTMGAISRISKVSGPKDDMLKRMHQPIAKYDQRAATRFGDSNEFKVSWLKTAGWTFAASLGQKLATYGVTVGGVKAACALGLTSATPAVAVTAALPYVAGATSMAMAAVGMYMNYQNYKKEAKAAGQKPKFKEFCFKQPYATTNAASVLGFAAGACLMTGNVPAATVLGVGCLAVAGYGTYKDAKAHGLSTGKAIWQAVKKGSAIAIGGAAGSYVGSLLGITPSYQKEGTNTPDQEKTGPTSHDYSEAERAHATNRLDDPRYSEFLNKFHVAHDLQDNADPNKVSADAVSNLRAGIESAIHATGDDKTFFTDIANDPKNPNFVMNTDMLGYKFEQLAYLAPNPNAQVDPAFAAAHHLPAGTTVGDYLSFKAPDGSTMNYMDALREVVSTGKSSNPLGFAEMLGKIENVVGGQINGDVNDAGKVTLLGTGPAVNPVQSYNAGADIGYDLGTHVTTVPGENIPGEIVPGHKLWGLGYWEPVKGMFGGMRKRAGAIADRLFSVFKPKKPKDEKPIDTPPGGIIKDDPKPEKKPYVTPALDSKNPLADEYKIVYGIEPTPAAEVAYKKLVLEELKSDRETGQTKADNLVDYITERKATYDKALATTVDPQAEIKGFHETKKGKEATAQARQDMFQTNLSFNGQDLPRNHMTLQKFTKFVTFALSNSDDRGAVTAAHDNSMGRSQDDKYGKRPSSGRFDVGTGQVSGQTNKKGVVDGKTGSMPNPKKGKEM